MKTFKVSGKPQNDVMPDVLWISCIKCFVASTCRIRNMNRANRLIFFAAILLLLVSCSNKNAKVLNEAERLVQENADSVICLLHSCDKASLSEHELAKYSLLYTMAQDKVGMDLDNDSLIRIAYNYYNEHNRDTLYAKCQYYMGTYYAIVDSLKECETCMTNAISASRKNHDSHTLYLALDRLSRTIRNCDPKSSIVKGKEALRVLEESEPENTINKTYLLLSIGEAYLFSQSKQDCYKYFNRALELAELLNDSALISYAYQDYATANLDFGDYSKALRNSSLSLHYSTYQYDSQHIAYAISLLECDSIQAAKQIFNNLLENHQPASTKFTIYEKLLQIAIKEKDISQALVYEDSIDFYAVLWNESMRDMCNDYYHTTIEQEKSKIHLMVVNKIRQRTIICISIIAAIIICFIFVLYRLHRIKARRRFDLAKQRHDYQLKLQEKLHKIELENQEKDFQRDMQLKDSQLAMMRQYMLDRLEIIKEVKEHTVNSKITLTDSDWAKIRNFLESVDSQFISRLSKQHTNLTEKDIRFCMLIRLGFTTKNLTDVYCVNERSIKQKLLKFKAKVGLFDPDTSFRQFIQSF